MRKAFAAGSLFATTHGSAPWRVVALPGWMHTATDFDPTLAALPVGSIAVDLPGFGGVNPEPPAAWGAAEYASWLEPLFDDLEGSVVVVGHSFGGRVAAHLAERRPDAVAALVLAGVPLLRRTDRPPAKAPAAFRAAKWLNKRGVLPDERMEAMRKKYGSADYRNADGIMRDVLVKVTNETYEEQLRAIRCPVELVWGENDDAAPVSVAREATTILGERAHLTVLPGVGHQVPIEASSALIEAIERQLTNV
ncbi:MAG TPA: alpha/beta hydrolase [Acidimicrobiales bacterium]|nr:alpha/beta hydrolase [Acidimicrobiales bacterium]